MDSLSGTDTQDDGVWRWRDMDTKSGLWVTVFFVVENGVIQHHGGLMPATEFFEAEIGNTISDVVAKYPTNTARSLRRVGARTRKD